MDARTAVGDAAVVQAVFDDTIALHQHMREVVQDSVIEAASAIRASLDAKDIEGAKTALSSTVSIVDKMATKGIIHRNTAGRYKSRLALRLTKAAA